MTSGSTMCSSPAAGDRRVRARLACAGSSLWLLACGCGGGAAGEGAMVSAATAPDRAAAPPGPGGTVAPGSGGTNLLPNGDFEEGVALPWTASFSDPASGKVAVAGGT